MKGHVSVLYATAPGPLPDQSVPVHTPMPGTTQVVLLIAMSLAALAMVAYSITESRRRRDLVPLFAVIGSGLAIFYEPLGDVLVKVFYSENGQISWIHEFGLGIPAFIGILYFWYLPIGAMWLLRSSRNGVSAKTWWSLWLGFTAFAWVFEVLIIKIGGPAWTYYGHQPFLLVGDPLTTPFTYTSFVVAIAAGVVALARYLPRRQHWLIVPAVPMLMLAGHAATSFPETVAMYDSNSTLLIDLGGLGSIALAAVLSYVVFAAVRRPRAQDKPTERTVAEPVAVSE